MNQPSDYVLGHSSRELDRLDLQGILYRDITRRALVDGGLTEGARVLDLGCGSGDVSRLAAEIVGPGGFVLGVDRDPAAVTAAAARSEAPNISFRVGDVGDHMAEEPFDAVVGRFILMHQPDPAATLASAARALRTGGVMVMVESSMDILLEGVHSRPRSDVYDRIVRWKCAVVGAAGADTRAGMSLPETFRAARLPAPKSRLEAVVDGDPDSLIWDYMAASVRSMLPQAQRLGVGTDPVAPVDTLAERLRSEVVGSGGVIVHWPVVVAWTVVP